MLRIIYLIFKEEIYLKSFGAADTKKFWLVVEKISCRKHTERILKKLILQKYNSKLYRINWNNIYFSETPCTHRRTARQVFNALISICINPVLTYNVIPYTYRLFFSSLFLLSFMPARNESQNENEQVKIRGIYYTHAFLSSQEATFLLS